MHRQMPVPGHDFTVDAGILDLIVTLNRVPGLRTTLSSCQGGTRHHLDRRVSIVGEAVPSFVAFIAQQRVPLSVRLSLEVKGYLPQSDLYWQPRHYKSILRLAQAFAEK